MRNRENEADRRSSINNKRRSRYKPTDWRLLPRIQMRQLRLSRRRPSQSSPSRRARRDRGIYEHQPQQRQRHQQQRQPTPFNEFYYLSTRYIGEIISKTRIRNIVMDIKII